MYIVQYTFPLLSPNTQCSPLEDSLLPVSCAPYLNVTLFTNKQKNKYFLLIAWMSIKYLEYTRNFCCINSQETESILSLSSFKDKADDTQQFK